MHVVYDASYLKCYSVHMSILFLKTEKIDLPYKLCDKEKHCLIWNIFCRLRENPAVDMATE